MRGCEMAGWGLTASYIMHIRAWQTLNHRVIPPELAGRYQMTWRSPVIALTMLNTINAALRSDTMSARIVLCLV